MNRRDETILAKVLNYCTETEAAHRFFADDKLLFLDESRGAIYRNADAIEIRFAFPVHHRDKLGIDGAARLHQVTHSLSFHVSL